MSLFGDALRKYRLIRLLSVFFKVLKCRNPQHVCTTYVGICVIQKYLL